VQLWEVVRGLPFSKKELFMPGVQYQYTGKKPFFVDRHAGTGLVWPGPGTVMEIDLAFVPNFERIYVDCIPKAGAQMRRVTSDADMKKVKADKTKVPAGTPYSSYAYHDLLALYVERTGKNPSGDVTASELIAGIQDADLTLASLGQTLDEF
jgi:hypothetical protein